MRIAIANLLVLVLLSSVALAGDLATDPNALYWNSTTWCGSTLIDEYGLKATIDYCVYGPGQFSYSGLGYTPTSGELVYAYQVFVESGSANVITFLVGLEHQADNIGTWQMSGGLDPNTVEFQGSPYDTAYWEWNPPMEAGDKSYGLAFSSVKVPEWGAGLVADGGGSAIGDLPTPSEEIPEPVTLGLLSVGAIVGGWRRHRH